MSKPTLEQVITTARSLPVRQGKSDLAKFKS